MIVPPPKRPRSTEDNILPLINVVFLLLIFFMLAGVLTQSPPFSLTPPRIRPSWNRGCCRYPPTANSP